MFDQNYIDRIQKAADELVEYDSWLKKKHLEEVAKKYGVDEEEVARNFLQQGIDDGWLIDEYFCD